MFTELMASGSGGRELSYSSYDFISAPSATPMSGSITLDPTHDYLIEFKETYTAGCGVKWHYINGVGGEDWRLNGTYPITLSLSGNTLSYSSSWYVGYTGIDITP